MFIRLRSLYFQKSKGFSYVEIVVMVAVIGILTTMVIASYNSGEQRQRVTYATHQVEQDLRKIQALSLAGKKDNSNSATERPCSFGIQFSNNSALEGSYIMFRELIATCDKKYDVLSSGDALLEGGNVFLPSGVIIGHITRFDKEGNIISDFSGDGSSNTTTINVVYSVPFAELSFYDDDSEVGSVKVEIKNKSGFSKVISIKSTGEISID